ncbi:NADH-quinone oxidoreductase subunit J family protein [Leptospira sp. GIMC2001]|uniref:NADH-quinone oxidoreductase subunit J family protein n=1 Tax=Leptospira sp. GIMC2001 TaxID=1513297 RepID=UPI00234A660C|nr:NADH-quinone oxidoreductase subunit J [Leptospira sp. GIMC2001]WCL48192.1 NADH-quinone oxidoreductase subunit J [Leptospira sp. GIMC2001]
MELINLQTFSFYFFATTAVLSALGVILHRNPISAAVLLVLTFFSLAAIYATIGAVFIATMQVLVYAGAIMVLVVFVLMLLSLRLENISKLWDNPIRKLGLFGVVGILLFLIAANISLGVTYPKVSGKGVNANGEYEYVFGQNDSQTNNPNSQPNEFSSKENLSKELNNISSKGQSDSNVVSAKGNVAAVGAVTFLEYLLPFEMISILLLVALVGAVILAKKRKEEEGV